MKTINFELLWAIFYWGSLIAMIGITTGITIYQWISFRKAFLKYKSDLNDMVEEVRIQYLEKVTCEMCEKTVPLEFAYCAVGEDAHNICWKCYGEFLKDNVRTWIPIEEGEIEPGVPMLGFNELWIDKDYSPSGVQECFIDDEGNWTYTKWCGLHDEWHTRTKERPGEAGYIPPTHYMLMPKTSDL